MFIELYLKKHCDWQDWEEEKSNARKVQFPLAIQVKNSDCANLRPKNKHFEGFNIICIFTAFKFLILMAVVREQLTISFNPYVKVVKHVYNIELTSPGKKTSTMVRPPTKGCPLRMKFPPLAKSLTMSKTRRPTSRTMTRHKK